MGVEFQTYRGRLAPTPSGLLHAGHARTFRAAWARARECGGVLVLRMEDIDRERCRAGFEDAALEDLHWLGLDWDEGGEKGGPYGPYRQSEKAGRHEELWRKLIRDGWIYPSPESRRDILVQNPARELDGGTLFPPGLRKSGKWSGREPDGRCNWRFRIPEGEVVEFEDRNKGVQRFVEGKDFGDFLVWRKAGGPSYELAVVADDLDMRITEVVRGEDLLLSTARQILLYQALGGIPPVFQHEKLVCNAKGERLSKTAHSVSIRSLREQGWTPDEVLNWCSQENPPKGCITNFSRMDSRCVSLAGLRVSLRGVSANPQPATWGRPAWFR